ncbi:MAG: ATP synthase F1 subunit gamma [Deltaproteobacteria bacterium]|nr:ATP synthase F1 subunit gamma [Deltaproteobacteria bacterium]
MATLKSIRKRIASVKNTQKVTRAMQMIAAARLRRAQHAALNARAYAKHAYEVALRIAAQSGAGAHPYLQTRKDVRVQEFLVLTSDRGLCGGFNENLVRQLITEWKQVEECGVRIHCTMIGRKGRDALKARGHAVREAMVGFYEQIAMAKVLPVVESLAQRYLRGEVDHVVLVYNRFRSMLAQDVTIEPLLPLVSTTKDQISAVDYLYEPSKPEVVSRLLERAVATRVYQACLESIAGELAARMTAMDSATKNAKEMIAGLTMQLNRARQASITRELLDIVNGAEALKK